MPLHSRGNVMLRAIAAGVFSFADSPTKLRPENSQTKHGSETRESAVGTNILRRPKMESLVFRPRGDRVLRLFHSTGRHRTSPQLASQKHFTTMPEINFIESVHNSTSRNYLERVVEHDKAACAELALQWGRDYWDGDRKTGYGGFQYDGRWRPVAQRIVDHYQLADDAAILDVGCGKAFLLYEFTQILPNCRVSGLDISRYAIENSKPEVRHALFEGAADQLPFADDAFDLVISINTLHNLPIDKLFSALAEAERVGRGDQYINVEAFRNEREKVNLMYWQLTCRAFHSPDEWRWIFDRAGYTGDYGFIFFE